MKLELVAPAALGAQPEVKPRSEEYEKLQTGWETMAALLLVVSQHEKSCSSTQQCERRVWYCFYILDHFVWWHLKCNQPFKEMKFSKRSARITSCGSPITNLQCSIRKLLQALSSMRAVSESTLKIISVWDFTVENVSHKSRSLGLAEQGFS